MNNLYTNTAINLLGVLIIMLMLFYLLKKFKVARYDRNNPMKIINTISIGSKERIILIQVNNTILLIGATPNHIETLHVFNESESKSAVLQPFAEQLAACNINNAITE